MILVIAAVLLVHDWYPPVCCGGRDCRPVACETIDKNLDWGLRGLSPDGRCHVCVGRGSDYPRCIFVPGPAPVVS